MISLVVVGVMQELLVRVYVVFVLGALALASTPAAVDADQAKGGASFFEVLKRIDLSRWKISHGWANGSYQNCTWASSNVSINAGALNLTLRDIPAAGRPFTCAEFKTINVYGYGTYEARMRVAPGAGLVTAFFTYTGPPDGKPHDEIDFEFVGKERREVQLNYFVDGRGNHGKNISLNFDPTTTFNDYALEWLPDSVRWFVNGALVHEVKRDANTPLPVTPGLIHFMVWNGVGKDMEGWLGKFEYPGQPLVAAVEHVAFTEAGKPCQFPTSIVCKREVGTQNAK